MHLRQTILIVIISSASTLARSQENLPLVTRPEKAEAVRLPPQQAASSNAPLTTLSTPQNNFANPFGGLGPFWSQESIPAIDKLRAPLGVTDISPIPPNESYESVLHLSKSSGPIRMTWYSDKFQHEKLLFEEKKLERQGVSRVAPLQLVESSTKFFAKSVLFPFAWTFGLHRLPENK